MTPLFADTFYWIALADFRQRRRGPTRVTAWSIALEMQTMHKEGLTEALTNDRHFEQEGFRALFRDL